MRTFENAGARPIKAWTEGVEMEPEAFQQLLNAARLPIVHPRGIAVMPDVHFGIGATVGSVIPTIRAIIPAAVGVDIGCGMAAVQTDLLARELPTSLKALRSDIEWSVPTGFNSHKDERAPWKVWEKSLTGWNVLHQPSLADGFERIKAKHPKALGKKSPATQLGTLGGGNHFVEVCLDEMDRVWVMLHSGSRGVGNQLGQYFIAQAKEHHLTRDGGFVSIGDMNLAWLDEGTTLFEDYVEAVGWAQRYARINRDVMLASVLKALTLHTREFKTVNEAINCHHNYVSLETHFGDRMYVTRKGAVRAGFDELGIIPGSMGTRSYIVRGKGNKDSYETCSHGAGRRMSRGRAKKEITLEQHIAATEGVECRKDAGVLDESPAAYKDIDAVIEAQADLVNVEHTLHAVLCVKG